MVVRDPVRAPRIGLCFRALVKATGKRMDTRVSIGVGTVEALPSGRVSEGGGVAFVLSGRGVAGAIGDLAIAIEGFERLDRRLRSARAIRGKGLNDIAQSWRGATAASDPITLPSVSGRLKAANWQAVSAALTLTERVLPALLARALG
jgi:hypothetical protein